MNKKRKKSHLREWLEAITFALIIVVSIRVFFVDLFAVPSTSMEKTILAGDFIIVSKLNYGPRVPVTPLTIPFTHQKLPYAPDKKPYTDIIQLPYMRLPGLSTVKRNDVIVFNYPMDTSYPVDHRTYYIKRCVALPGDTLKIQRAKVLINGTALPDPETAQHEYVLTTEKEGVISKALMQQYEINEGGPVHNLKNWQLTMTENVAREFENMEGITSMEQRYDSYHQYYDFIFPYAPQYSWSRDYYGPVVIPRKGDSILLTLNNLPLYKRIIETYEGNELEILENNIYINGKKTDHYRFRMNYYFAIGDNRHNSGDSRFWGFVPENHLVGKAIMVLFSMNKEAHNFTDKIRWNRIFKVIHRKSDTQ